MATWTKGEYLAVFRSGYAASSSLGKQSTTALANETARNFLKNCEIAHNEGHWSGSRAPAVAAAERVKTPIRLWKVYGELRGTVVNIWNPIFARLMPGDKLPSGTQKQELFNKMWKRIFVHDTYKKIWESHKKKEKNIKRKAVSATKTLPAPAAPLLDGAPPAGEEAPPAAPFPQAPPGAALPNGDAHAPVPPVPPPAHVHVTGAPPSAPPGSMAPPAPRGAAPSAPVTSAPLAAPETGAPTTPPDEALETPPEDEDSDDDDDYITGGEEVQLDGGDEVATMSPTEEEEWKAFLEATRIEASELKLLGIRKKLPQGVLWAEMIPPPEFKPTAWVVWELHGPFSEEPIAAIGIKTVAAEQASSRSKLREEAKKQRKAARLAGVEGTLPLPEGSEGDVSGGTTLGGSTLGGSRAGAARGDLNSPALEKIATAKMAASCQALWEIARDRGDKDVMNRAFEEMQRHCLGTTLSLTGGERSREERRSVGESGATNATHESDARAHGESVEDDVLKND